MEESLFVIMPLVHAEDASLLGLALRLTHELVARAPASVRPAWELGARRVSHYQEVIARFGRFPHRNAILGRKSTAEELAFLAEEAREDPLAEARRSA